MKNWRNGRYDPPGPPFHHEDPSPRVTVIRTGHLGVVIAPGPVLLHFVLQPQEPDNDVA